MKTLLIAVFAAIACIASSAFAERYDSVQVLKVIDGDSFNALISDGTLIRVRMATIDAPESQQAYGAQSRLNLVAILARSPPSLDCYKKDRNHRHVCRVYVDGKDIGLEQVSTGSAWWYRRYLHEQPRDDWERYQQAEWAAKDAKRGLWGKDAIEPEKWRAYKRSQIVK